MELPSDGAATGRHPSGMGGRQRRAGRTRWFLLGWLGAAIALLTRRTETTFLIGNFLTLPLLFVSSAQLPLGLLPDWRGEDTPIKTAVADDRFYWLGQSAALRLPNSGTRRATPSTR